MVTLNMKAAAVMVAVLGVAGMMASSADAALLVYEGFDYAAGDVYNGSSGTQQTGGTGLESVTGWTTSGSNPYDVWSTGLSFGTLSTTGKSVRRSSFSGDAKMHRELTVAVAEDVTSGSTVWFSLLMKDTSNYDHHTTGTFFLSDGPITNAGAKGTTQKLPGDALGVTFRHAEYQGAGMDVQGIASESGTTILSTGFVDGPTPHGNTTYLIVGRIDWATGSNDALTLYNLATTTTWDGTAPDASYQFATVSADVDQSALTTLAMGEAQYTTVDEIRFGETFADVVPGLELELIPEPATMALLGLGGLMMIRRRKA
jgi:hypothetical protein